MEALFLQRSWSWINFAWSKKFVLFLSVFIGICGFRLFLAEGLRGDDDNIHFYLAGLDILYSEQVKALNLQVLDYFTDRGANAHGLYRWQYHVDFWDDFKLPGAVLLAVSRAFKFIFGLHPQLYPLFLGQTIFLGYYATKILFLCAAATVIATIPGRILAWAFALTILLFSLNEAHYLYFTDPADFSWFGEEQKKIVRGAKSFAAILAHKKESEIFHHIWLLLTHPGAQFSALGIPPRANLFLMMIAVFALRWRGRYGLSYLLVFGLSLIHLSFSGLILVTMIGLDLLLRPRILITPFTGTVVFISLVAFFTSDSLLGLVGEANIKVAIAVLIVVAAFVCVMLIGPVRERTKWFQAPLIRLRERILSFGRIVSDLFVLVLGWIVTVVALHLVIKYFQPFNDLEFLYFWGRVHGRMMVLLWPSLIFGIGILVIASLAKKNAFRHRRRGAAKTLISVLTLFVLVASWKSVEAYDVMDRVTREFNAFEQRSRQGNVTDLEPMGFNEGVLYYAISKTVDTGRDYVSPLLSRVTPLPR